MTTELLEVKKIAIDFFKDDGTHEATCTFSGKGLKTWEFPRDYKLGKKFVMQKLFGKKEPKSSLTTLSQDHKGYMMVSLKSEYDINWNYLFDRKKKK